MLNSIIKNKWFTEVVVVVVILGIGYYVWSSQGSGPLLTDGSTSVSPQSQEILTTLGQLHTIKLDQTIFTNSVFVSLSDFGVSIPPQTAGRRNPFAPVGK